MSIKGKLEAIIYAAEEPVSLDQLAALVKDSGLESPTPEGEQPPDPKAEKAELKSKLRVILGEMIADCANDDRGLEIRQVAGGYRISTKPEHHDAVRSFAKSLKPPIRLSLQALETLAVIAYKQPVTAPEISEIRGVDSSGVLATLIDRKLITTAGRKAVIGRPILYKTTKDFLLRFGLKDVNELPSMEEFEKMTMDTGQDSLFDRTPVADATGIPDEAAPEQAVEPASDDAHAAFAQAGSESDSSAPTTSDTSESEHQ
ncbi:MAG: condensin subunit ScpB [Acidobacteriales bacterium]|nr:condensin subunit ScpB [Terriglobales bacterium]